VIRENDVYDTDLALIFYDEPLLARYENWSNEIFKNPRYFDLRANLRHFSDVYARMYSERRPIAAYLTAHPDWSAADRERFAEFYSRFYVAVDRDRLATSRALERLGSR